VSGFENIDAAPNWDFWGNLFQHFNISTSSGGCFALDPKLLIHTVADSGLGLVPTLRKPKMEPGCTLMDCPLSESKVTACCYWKLIKP
jgi:hypothetical protein